jgi:hypothetical protein
MINYTQYDREVMRNAFVPVTMDYILAQELNGEFDLQEKTRDGRTTSPSRKYEPQSRTLQRRTSQK